MKFLILLIIIQVDNIKNYLPLSVSNGITLKCIAAVMRIEDSNYGGYQYGLKAGGSSAMTCDKTTGLMPNQETKGSSLWKKLTYGMGYSLGICYRGKDLAASADDITPVPWFVALFLWLYNLHSIELSIGYPIRGINAEFKLAYSWANLHNVRGLYQSWKELGSDDYAHVYTTDWKLRITKFGLAIKYKPNLFFGIFMCFSNAYTIEEFLPPGYPAESLSSTLVRRFGRGWSLFLEWRKDIKSLKYVSLVIKLEAGGIKEYKNNSPWEWKEKLFINVTGFYVGIIFKKGGAE